MDFERNTGAVGDVVINPWQGFAHVEHRSDEFEALNKTLRFALIQLNKFWVEVNSFPVFMNELKGASIQEIERLFVWLQASPPWSERVHHPRLIPELARPEIRDRLVQFAEQVRQVRGLRLKFKECFQEAERRLPGADVPALHVMQSQLASVIALTRSLSLESGNQADVAARGEEISARLVQNARLQRFFSRLSSEYGLPEALSLREAGRIFTAAASVRRASPALLSWRKPQILGPQQRIRIEAWQDRARPILETRKRLQSVFMLEDAAVTPDQLRSLATHLKAAGAFRAFNGAYKESVKQYHALLRSDPGSKSVSHGSPQDMAERLEQWAGFLELKMAFDSNPEAGLFFAPHFQGLDTDFAEALAANAWASALRAELKVVNPEEFMREAAFCAKLLDAVFGVSQEKLQFAATSCAEDEAGLIQEILREKEYMTGREFADVGCDEEARLLETNQLSDNLCRLQIRAEARLDSLNEIRELAGELLSLLKRVESCAEAQASLKALYQGENTDLSVVDTPLAYVEFVEKAGLPQSLHASLLGTHGPQRLHDTRKLVAPALHGLAAVKEHLNRLDAATHGQSRTFESRPLIDLIDRIQLALKKPTALAEWVNRLKEGTRAVDLEAPRS